MVPVRAYSMLVVAAEVSMLARAWNAFATLDRVYSFQEFYTDAQYGPDFGYYSTGKILHTDGPSDLNGTGVGVTATETGGDSRGGQEWFNSYTTLPMSLSPYFGQLMCDRLAGMWAAMGKPAPFAIVEFGGGTGMFARDILQSCETARPAFFHAMRYVLGERSPALRLAQRRTAAKYCKTRKLQIIAADARTASAMRPELEVDGIVRGFIISNEVFDELDPVRLRLHWKRGRPPVVEACETCRVYHEAHVLHFIDDDCLAALLKLSVAHSEVVQTIASIPSRHSAREEISNAAQDARVRELVEAVRWDGRSFLCGLLDKSDLRRVISDVAALLTPSERHRCAPLQVCCLAMVIALDRLVNHFRSAFHLSKSQWSEDALEQLVALYRGSLARTNATVPLTKQWYKELRRRGAQLGAEVETALLVGGATLPGRVRSEEVHLALSPARCLELEGWRKRNAKRLALAAALRSRVAPSYDRRMQDNGVEHLKLVVRPGEAEFVREAGKLLDEGFMVSMDYGADADALIWQSLVHPNFQGIHTMDARAEFASVCTQVSFLECPGLQDLTTSVDFTEIAVAGAELGGWTPLFYGPLFGFEVPSVDAFLGETLPNLAERAGGPRTVGLHSWYRKPEGEQWVSFKVLVQHRGTNGVHWRFEGSRASSLLKLPSGMRRFGFTPLPHAVAWPLDASPRLLSAPSLCWRLDISKPPFAAVVSKAARAVVTHIADAAEVDILAEAWLRLLDDVLLDTMVEEEYRLQTQAHRDLHLALILADYYLYIAEEASKLFNTSCFLAGTPERRAEWLNGAEAMAENRRLRDMYGPEMFDRVMEGVADAVEGVRSTAIADPYICVVAQLICQRCAQKGRVCVGTSDRMYDGVLQN